MRPGQTAPECSTSGTFGCGTPACFNEAGADCPGMLSGFEKQVAADRVASMRPGQTAPECQLVGRLAHHPPEVLQ